MGPVVTPKNLPNRNPLKNNVLMEFRKIVPGTQCFKGFGWYKKPARNLPLKTAVICSFAHFFLIRKAFRKIVPGLSYFEGWFGLCRILQF